MALKITELIKQCEKFTYSFEVTPDIKVEDLVNLDLNPLFYSITWHAKTHKCENLSIASVELAKYLRSNGKHVLLHLSCDLLRKEYLDSLLKLLQNNEICNLFVILGECYDPSSSDFQSTKELIRHIREVTGNYFCIGVAGFPGQDDKLKSQKQKVDAGADFILTQAFFELHLFKNYLSKCKDIGISIPIIPGIFSFETEAELSGFVNLCKVHVNDEFKQKVVNGNGPNLLAKLINEMIHQTNTSHFHFFTLNKILRTSNLLKLLNN